MSTVFSAHPTHDDVPHRHDFYTILFIQKAEGQHIIDFNTYDLGQRQVFFVSPGQVHQMLESKPSKGWALTIRKEFLETHHIDTSFISEINLFRDFGDTPPLTLEKEIFHSMEQLILQMRDCIEKSSRFHWEAVGAYLKLFLINANNQCVLPQHNTPHSPAEMILRNFKLLVEKYYKSEHQVQFYADQLFISTDHLNRTIDHLIGKKAKQFIQNRILLEAKRLLQYSDSTAKEIGYHLGFKEAAHFSNFFKKMTGVSISQWIKNQAI
ncbi:helix-turn-helix transcriptional regulator [Algivirga pacifica]